MSGLFRRDVFLVMSCCALLGFVTLMPAQAAVTKPTCEAAEPWVLGINPKDRWYPNPAQKRFWLPASFEGPAFEALFGVPATDWTLEDVKEIRPLLQACAKAARKEKRGEAQKAFNAARGFVSGNLKNYLVQTARASAKLDQTLGKLLDLPDSPALLQVLAQLRELKAGDKSALQTSQRRITQIGGAEAKAARPIVNAAYRQTPAAFAADTLPRLDERYQALRASTIGQAEVRLADHPSGASGLDHIDAALSGIREEFAAGLLPEDYTQLEAVAEGEREGLWQGVQQEAEQRIDALATAPASIGEVDQIIATASALLDPGRASALRLHGETRQQEMAEEILRRAEEGLAGFPETLSGIEDLDRHVTETSGIVVTQLEAVRLESFRKAAEGRRAVMAQAALPEFETRIAGLGGDPAGLQALNAEAARIAAWDGLKPDTRDAYLAALSRRQGEIEQAIAAAAAAREAERQRRVVSATKARIDALSPRFRSLQGISAEVEDARGKGLDPESMAEIETHAAARRQALADEILTLATPKLGEAPETFEALGQLITFVDTVIEETKAAASPSALQAFEGAATDASSALGRKLFDGFETELAALPEDRQGLKTAEEATQWAEGWRRVDAGLRSDYIEVARQRRDAIANKLAALEAERRERVLAAGGDPELVGYTFADDSGMSTLEFADEERVIFAVLGLRFGGKYAIVKDDVFVEGPNGTIVFARDGTSLTGMGLVLKRVAP